MVYWLWCYVIALLILIVSVAYAFIAARRNAKARVVTPFYIVFGGLFGSIFFCLLPIYYSTLFGVSDMLLKTVVFSLHTAFQIFTINADRAIILESIRCPQQWLSAAYSAYLSVAFVAAPVMTFGFLLSFFKNALAYLRYALRYRRDVYVFSELNEKSVTLGADIKRNHKRSVIVYTDVFNSNDGVESELMECAHDLRAICFKKDILTINFRSHSPKAQITFFSIGEDESKNTDQALKLIDRYKERANTHLYVFSSRIDGGLLMTRADKGKVKVRRVNEIRSLIYRTLYQQGQQLFSSAKEMPDGKKRISAVLVGTGGHGTEMLKALSWYCQMDGYRVEIDAFDRDKLAEDRFCALAPELMSEKYNGVSIPGEAEYGIRIHSGYDVTTKSFMDAIMKLKDTTYVFVSLGSDAVNIRTAVELRMIFERMGIQPVIQTVIYNTEEKTALEGITNYRGQQYNIDFVGDTASSYSEAVIMSSDMEAEALQLHKKGDEKWEKEKGFWQYEYYYNSSVTSAIHMKARKECNIPGAGKPENELTDAERTIIGSLEHRRWNAYMRSEGYISSGSPEEDSRNDLAKMHHCLVDYSSLPSEEKEKDARVGAM